MADTFDLVVHGGTVLTPGGRVETALGVREGRIAAIGDIAPDAGADNFDARGLHVLPGAIDTQVHFREPGGTHKEDLASGTTAAVLGGITGVFEMPNTNPATVGETDLLDKLRRAEGRTRCEIAFFMGASPENAARLGMLERLPGCCGVKVFMGSSTGSLLVSEDEQVAAVLASITRRAAFHSEDEARLIARESLIGPDDTAHKHPKWRDVETARRSTERLLRLARKAGKRIHILHVTTADELPLIAANKDLATAETTPQHLTLAAPDCYDRLGNYARMNPPIRTAEHREALWQAVNDGVIDVIGSDHAPHTREEKEQAYADSPSGMPGVQTLVPVLLDHVSQGRLSLERFVDITSTGPGRIYNIAGKGRVAVGYDADFTIVDLKAKRTIENSWIASKCGWTPFDGMEVTGWPRATIIRGNLVMRDDEVLGPALGRPFRFQETLEGE